MIFPSLVSWICADSSTEDAADVILALPLSPEVKKINPNGVAALAKDVAHLSAFVDGLENAMILKENLDELQQVQQHFLLHILNEEIADSSFLDGTIDADSRQQRVF